MDKKQNGYAVVTEKTVKVNDKMAVRIELQQGTSAGHAIALARMYDKDGGWAYGKDNIRFVVTDEIAKELEKAIAGVLKANKETPLIEKKGKPEIDTKEMDEDALDDLLARLIKEKKARAAKEKEEVVLTQTTTKTTKKKK